MLFSLLVKRQVTCLCSKLTHDALCPHLTPFFLECNRINCCSLVSTEWPLPADISLNLNLSSAQVVRLDLLSSCSFSFGRFKWKRHGYGRKLSVWIIILRFSHVSNTMENHSDHTILMSEFFHFSFPSILFLLYFYICSSCFCFFLCMKHCLCRTVLFLPASLFSLAHCKYISFLPFP